MEESTKGLIILGIIGAFFFVHGHHVLWSYFRDRKNFWSDLLPVYRRWWQLMDTKGCHWYRLRKQLIAEREQAERDKDAARRNSSAQKRRETARIECEVLFHQHAHRLGNRFSKEAFDDFVRRNMGDGLEPEIVEERSRQLKTIILSHVEQIEPAKPKSVEALTEWFNSTKRAIEKLPIDDRQKQSQIGQLNQRYAELMESLLEDLRP